MYHSDPIKYIFLESFWSGRVKYCIFDDDGPKYLGRGTKFSQDRSHLAKIFQSNGPGFNKGSPKNKFSVKVGNLAQGGGGGAGPNFFSSKLTKKLLWGLP